MSLNFPEKTSFLSLYMVPKQGYVSVSHWPTKRRICPQKDAYVVPRDSVSPADPTFLRDKHCDVGEGAVCDLCVRSARPNLFFGRRSSSTSSSAPQSVDVGLQVPSAPLVVCGAATSLATESMESGVEEPLKSIVESSSTATRSTAHPPAHHSQIAACGDATCC